MIKYITGLLSLLVGVFVLRLLLPWPVQVISAQDLGDKRTKESYKLELQYLENQYKQCRINLADVWEQANQIEQARVKLMEEFMKLKEAHDEKKAN